MDLTGIKQGFKGSEVQGSLEDRGLRFEASMVRFFFASNLKPARLA
jgi:hypothetical protein